MKHFSNVHKLGNRETQNSSQMCRQIKEKKKEDDNTIYYYTLASTWLYLPNMKKENVNDDIEEQVDVEEYNISSYTKKVKNLCIVEDILLYPPRLKTLLACDSKIIPPSEHRRKSFGMVMKIGGRNMSMIAMPLTCLLIWDVIWVIAFTLQKPSQKAKDLSTKLGGLVSPLLVPVSFLLVFRLGRTAVRFWDARAAVGKVIIVCRNLMSTVAAAYINSQSHHHNELVKEFSRWLCVFPISVKNYVRPSAREGWNEEQRQNKRRFEIGLLLDEKDTNDVVNVKQDQGELGPVLVVDNLRRVAFELSVSEGNESVRTAFYRQVNEQLDVLTDAWGAIERINLTPLPFVYVVHLRTFLLLYLAFWHLESLSKIYFSDENTMEESLWIIGATLPFLFFESWSLLGIEAASVECEKPFGWQSNHLAMGKMCVLITQNVAQTLKNLTKSARYGN